ncbi:MAG: UDP-N-acetylmuramate dehydrogenase [Deltaproteobacteria bacterium]|nr:UDP-N-acetylmuramate dehydrogenase [Deltaproteobacteria bacterium]
MIPRSAREALEEALGDRVRFDFPLARCTSLKIGGPVDALATPATREEVARTLSICAAHQIPHCVIGGGFNTLALDDRLEGVAIQLGKLRGLEERPDCSLRVETGVSHSQLTNYCIERGLAGLEFGCGIPGSIGGWLAMNAGIPGREVKDVVLEIEVISPTGREVRHIPRTELRFVYRALRGLAPGSVILSALFSVTLSDTESVREEVARLLAARQGSQPLNVPSCGSVFKNPPGDFAGRLIDAAGLKGHRLGGAEISPIHANFIANRGGATAADVLALIQKAQAAVWQTAGVRLVTEVRVIGGKP